MARRTQVLWISPLEQRTAATIRLGAESSEQGTRIFYFRFSAPSGVDQFGKNLYGVRVVVHGDEITTAFPVP